MLLHKFNHVLHEVNLVQHLVICKYSNFLLSLLLTHPGNIPSLLQLTIGTAATDAVITHSRNAIPRHSNQICAVKFSWLISCISVESNANVLENSCLHHQDNLPALPNKIL
jgi:hypothetical protein